MKYKHVFLIWLLADLLLAAALLVIAVWSSFTDGGSDLAGLYLLVVAYGIAISLPSLIIMTIFYFILKQKISHSVFDRKPYIILIISINILYLLAGWITRTMEMSLNWFYLCSTAAGLISLYIVTRKIKKSEISPQNFDVKKTVTY